MFWYATQGSSTTSRSGSRGSSPARRTTPASSLASRTRATTRSWPINQGYEIQIYDGTTGEPQKTGSIYNFKREETRNSNPIGEWNDYEIRAVGQQYTITLNGTVVNTFTGARNLAGYLGLQNHDASSHVHFRYVRIKEIDTTPPSTTATLDAAEPDGSNGWYRSPVHVTLNAADDEGGAGVARTEYSVGGGPWTTYGGPFEVGSDGSHTVAYRSVDRQDNVEEPKAVSFKIDRTAPQVTCTVTPTSLWPPNHKLVAATAQVSVGDATSGPAGFSLTEVVSSEPDSGTGPEDVPGDISGWTVGTADTEGSLRAERADGRDGRTYTLTYSGSDAAGNQATCRVSVVVAKKPK